MLLIIAVLYFSRSQHYRIREKADLISAHKTLMLSAASSSLTTSDVPVGALLLYHDSVFTTGNNTVRKDSDIAGHAEINAINLAIRKIGFKAFSELDRDELILVSSFEPCMMCINVIIEYNIRRVYFMKEKTLTDWLKGDAKLLRYEWNKFQTAGDEQQDSLFKLHPAYPRAGR